MDYHRPDLAIRPPVLIATLLLLFAAPSISLDRGTIVVTGIDKDATIAVYVEPRKEGQPAMLGKSRVEGGKLVFEPRFPLTPGVKYRVVVGSTETVVGIPKVEKKPTTTLAVFPSGDVLPENQLKFYLHFSTPMAQGDVYRHIKLLDDFLNTVEQNSAVIAVVTAVSPTIRK